MHFHLLRVLTTVCCCPYIDSRGLISVHPKDVILVDSAGGIQWRTVKISLCVWGGGGDVQKQILTTLLVHKFQITVVILFVRCLKFDKRKTIKLLCFGLKTWLLIIVGEWNFF